MKRKINDKIVTLDNLAIILEKEKDKKIIFTNGCFDIIHSGHTTMLERCSQYGDLLIVGLNSDLSIKRLKGNDRPILSEEERCAMIASLESVDYVILFDGDTPLESIKMIKPDVYIKGGDYTLDNMIGNGLGFKDIKNFCKDAKILQFERNISTTQIINKIINMYK